MAKMLLNICSPLLLFAILLFSTRSATSSPFDHRYDVGDLVPMFVNKVGPLNNPSETYQYYELPFCRPDPIIWKKETLGEVLNGDRLASTLYELKFQEEKIGDTLCSKKLKGYEVAKLREAVANDFYFQMYYDGLPLWGYVGKIEEDNWSHSEKKIKYYLFTHVQFDAFYNGNQVIEMHAFSDPNHVMDITEDVDINVQFTYSVFWNATEAQFESRMNKYSRASSLLVHHQIHWFSFVNSVVIIVLLMGLLILIFMRHLKNDLMKCSDGDEEEDKEVGWKHIHGDVFRYPRNMSLFSAVLGVGHQLLTISVFCGGSTAIFMFAYCIYFYIRSNMSGFMQLSFFLGYNALMCYAFFLICGTISFRASLIFVGRIYCAVKSE